MAPITITSDTVCPKRPSNCSDNINVVKTFRVRPVCNRQCIDIENDHFGIKILSIWLIIKLLSIEIWLWTTEVQPFQTIEDRFWSKIDFDPQRIRLSPFSSTKKKKKKLSTKLKAVLELLARTFVYASTIILIDKGMHDRCCIDIQLRHMDELYSYIVGEYRNSEYILSHVMVTEIKSFSMHI